MTPTTHRSQASEIVGRSWAILAALLLLFSASDSASASGLEPGDIELVEPPVRNGFSDETIYYLLTDRFDNGDVANDTGGAPGAGPLDHGFLATNKDYYHGGDIAGLLSKLNYLQDLGITAICITQPFANRPVQGDGTIGGSAAAYHGNWPLDFTQIDPHFGSAAELQALIDAVHARGMKVFFDIVAGHTADVIQYVESPTPYRDKTTFPYRDSTGVSFDDRDYVGTGSFPPLDPAGSFPYTPTFDTSEDANAKAPAWLNDPIYYHNRGNSDGTSESAQYGDFFGLDDLFTEHPTVVDGMIDIYEAAVSVFGVDGFRLDDIGSVNEEFWSSFVQEILAWASAQGIPDFMVFGEAPGANPGRTSEYMTRLQLPSMLDFDFDVAARQFAVLGAPSDVLRDHFDQDDLYTDTNSNAHDLVKFTGNHDEGRLGRFIDVANPGVQDAERVARSTLAHALNFFSRGQPVIYYGDEQGFTGDGGDADSRQDMFASLVASYINDDLIGTDNNSGDDNFDETHPLYQVFTELNSIRRMFPALRQGAQIHRHSEPTPGLYAFSRIDRGERVEYLVVANNSSSSAGATIPTASPATSFVDVYPGTGPILMSDGQGRVAVSVAGLGYHLYEAQSPLPASGDAPGIALSAPLAGSQVFALVEVQADLDRTMFAEVTFAVSVAGGPFTVLGTDDNPPYRVFYDTSSHAMGTSLRFKAIVDDQAGHYDADDVTVTTGTSVGAEDLPMAGSLVLHEAIPNPFNPQTTLAFSLPAPSHARLTILDARGRRVATLLDEVRPEGRQEVVWRRRDDRGRAMASGVYFYRIDAGGFVETKRMVLLK